MELNSERREQATCLLPADREALCRGAGGPGAVLAQLKEPSIRPPRSPKHHALPAPPSGGAPEGPGAFMAPRPLRWPRGSGESQKATAKTRDRTALAGTHHSGAASFTDGPAGRSAGQLQLWTRQPGSRAKGASPLRSLVLLLLRF